MSRTTVCLVLSLSAGWIFAGCVERDPLSPIAPDFTPSSLVIPITGYMSVTAGRFSSCALRTDGTIDCWGDDGWGRTSPPSGTFVDVDNGSIHNCALRTDGTIACWGSNFAGESSSPGGEFIRVSSGVGESCGIRTDGTLACWGFGTEDRSGTFSEVSVGAFHNCAIRSDGTLTCWGFSDDGRTSPPGGTFTEVSAGRDHSCAIRSDGTLACWGFNDNGRASPPTGTFIEVSAGEDHTCGLRPDGSLECWGGNGYGQSNAPPGPFLDMAVGDGHSCAVRTDTSIVCWGRDDRQQAMGPALHIAPAATFSAAPASVTAGQSFTLSLTDAAVPGHPEVTAFTYAFDCGNGAGYGSFGAQNVMVCATSAVGTRTVKGKVQDPDGTEGEYTSTVEVIDGTAPTISLITPADGAVYLLGESVVAEYSCADAESGVAMCVGNVANGAAVGTGTVGSQSFTVDASDLAGNSTSVTHGYAVAYDFIGFAAPISDGVNLVKAGQAIPLKWRLLDADGQPIITLTAAVVSTVAVPCEGGDAGDVVDEAAVGRSGLQNLGDGYYQFNFASPKNYAGSCRILHLDLGEGITRTATFRFTK
jgi:hypothetical protein